MQIPNGNSVVVDEAKVRDYLLSSDHPIGRFKARVFAALGYRRSNWPQLRDDLRAVAAAADAQLLDTNAFGERWMVRGTLRGPTGASLHIITIWLIPLEGDVPRLVTAYPAD
jgi:hypothetical protein